MVFPPFFIDILYQNRAFVKRKANGGISLRTNLTTTVYFVIIKILNYEKKEELL